MRPVICAFQVRAQAAAIPGAADPPRMVERFAALLWGDLLGARAGAAANSESLIHINEQVQQPLINPHRRNACVGSGGKRDEA